MIESFIVTMHGMCLPKIIIIIIMHRMFLLKEYPLLFKFYNSLFFFSFLEKFLARFVTILVILCASHGDYKIIEFFKYHTSLM